jgi:hypothetical protein
MGLVPPKNSQAAPRSSSVGMALLPKSWFRICLISSAELRWTTYWAQIALGVARTSISLVLKGLS